jgi:hypothetical protein
VFCASAPMPRPRRVKTPNKRIFFIESPLSRRVTKILEF